MGGPGRFPTARAVAIQEAVKGAIDLEYDFAADAASPVRRHPHLPNQSKGFGSGSCVSRHVSKWHFSEVASVLGDVRSLGQSGSYLKMLGVQLVIQTRHSADDSPATHSIADILMSPPLIMQRRRLLQQFARER